MVSYYPLLTTKRALKEGIRHHVARFASKREVDPSNQDEFTRPVVLHRRDPRQPAPGKAAKEEEIIEEPIDSKEREKQEAAKAEKDRQKAEDLAQIAPSGNNASAMAQKKNQPFRNEKTTQVHRLDKSAEEKKASDLRYEEALPWHLEDADNKSTWVGNYEAALSHVNVMFYVDGPNFKMIPLEKWYKFSAKPQFKVFTIEEAEAQMGKKVKESRWVMKTDEEKQALRDSQESKKMTSMFTVKGETNTFKSSSKRETEDMDQLDFAEDDLFQDDDEQPGFDPADDSDSKDIKVKIKREQLGANLFGDADEHEVDALFEEEEKEKELTKKEGKGTRKALKKRERNLNYDSDSEHPYSSSVRILFLQITTTNIEQSDDDTSDEEKQAEIDKKKDEEAKAKAKLEAQKTDSKLPSGASSKGNNTPSGRPKHSDPLKKVKSLKRPGSPNLSESSGNESTRKKHKKNTGTSTPRALSSGQPIPGQTPRKSSIIKLAINPNRLTEINSHAPNPNAAMSDGEATGGEMSEGGKKKKIKLRMQGSPNASRAGSPAPGKGGSRAGSPQAPGKFPSTISNIISFANIIITGGSRTPINLGPISAEELKAAIPPAGITIQSLMKIFSNRIGDPKENKTDKKDFIQMVKVNSEYGADKMLKVKASAPKAAEG